MTSEYRSPGGRILRWQKIIEACRAAPGVWIVQLPNERTRLVGTIRNKLHPLLRLDDGELEAVALNQHRSMDGTWHGDIYVRFVSRT